MQAPESQLHEKLGGLEAMDELIDVSSAESETKVIKFANKLSFALRSSVEYEFLLQVRCLFCFKSTIVSVSGFGRCVVR